MAYSGAVFSFRQDWSDPIIERLQWLTDVLTHRDNTEQRIQSRPSPRRQFEYSVLMKTPNERARLDHFVFKYQDNAILLPIWTDATRLTAAASSGQPDVTVDTVGYDYDAGEYLILWRSPSSYEAVEIDSLTSTTVTLAENLGSTWAAGTVVAPARLARMSAQVRGQSYVPDVRPYKFLFDIDEASVSSNRVTAISPSTYRSRDVFNTAPETSEPEDFNFDHAMSLIDFQIGGVGVDSTIRPYPRTLLPYSQKFFDRTTLGAFWGFLDRRQGQRVPFWYGTWDKDFDATTWVSSASASITYTENGYADLVGVVDGRKDIIVRVMKRMLLFNPGDFWTDRITTAVNNGNGTETISGFSIQNADDGVSGAAKIRVSFLRYCRLASDIVEIAWESAGAAQVKLAFREMLNVP